MVEQDNFAEELIREVEEEQKKEILVHVDKNFFLYSWLDKLPVQSRWRLLLFLPNFLELIKLTSKIAETQEENGEKN